MKSMNARRQAKPSPQRVSGFRAKTGAEVKTSLHERGMTVKAWAEKNGFPYATVSHVLRGVNRGTYGMGYRIAVALGMREAA